MTNTAVIEVQDRRRSNAATAIPSKKVRRQTARSQQKRAAIERSVRGY